MSRHLLGCSLLLLCWIAPVHASDRNAIEIVPLLAADSSLLVGVDLTGLITSSRVDRLQQGINIKVVVDIELRQPRRLFGTRKIGAAKGAISIDHDPVTHNYRLTRHDLNPPQGRSFFSLAGLHKYLADSVILPLATTEPLGRYRLFTLHCQSTVISLTSIDLTDPDSADRSDSPVEYLFRQFLILTDFGREQFSFSSRPFSLSELHSQSDED
ncbi:MAG: DUF4390 domain-containing protein [Candidatus Zixiibacteriota bacterium]